MHPHTRTIARDGDHELVIKKSRFICTLARVASEEDARAFIEGLRKRYWDANHNCSAYRIGPGGRFQRSNDDGEPSGTAGAPMLAVLTKRDLTDVVAVVTRHFGGVLLGAGGLVRAYGQSVSDAVDLVGIVERKPLALIEVETDYGDAGRIENALRASEYHLAEVRHGAGVTFEIPMDEPELPGFQTWLAELTNGRGEAKIAGHTVIEMPVG